MPKQKTKKSVAKRVKITKKKRVLYFKTGRRHLLSAKTRKRKRGLRQAGEVPKGRLKHVKRVLPYSF